MYLLWLSGKCFLFLPFFLQTQIAANCPYWKRLCCTLKGAWLADKGRLEVGQKCARKMEQAAAAPPLSVCWHGRWEDSKVGSHNPYTLTPVVLRCQRKAEQTATPPPHPNPTHCVGLEEERTAKREVTTPTPSLQLVWDLRGKQNRQPHPTLPPPHAHSQCVGLEDERTAKQAATTLTPTHLHHTLSLDMWLWKVEKESKTESQSFITFFVLLGVDSLHDPGHCVIDLGVLGWKFHGILGEILLWGCSSVGRASDWHTAEAGLIPRCGKGFFLPVNFQCRLSSGDCAPHVQSHALTSACVLKIL